MKFLSIIIVSCLFLSCGKMYSPEEKIYIASVQKSRQTKDDFMKNDPSSPFKRDSLSHFSPLKYFDVDPDFKFTSVLHEFDQKDTVIILGTKGEERKTVKFGYLLWKFRGKEYRINVYKGFTRSGQEYYSIWFTDRTTGKTTYHVGRYIDFELNPDKNHLYTIDFNDAYSPYCSYSSSYSCAVPSKEDFIDVAIEAGEKSFHD